MKAILEENEKYIPKVHKLLTLYNLVSLDLNDLDEDILSSLDRLYIESRYPGDMGLLPNGKPSIEDSIVFYNFAKNVYNKVCKILNYNG